MLRKKLFAEFLGTAVLVATVVGSGIMATNLSPDLGIDLLINTVATVFVLYILITLLAPISGAHFNPAVTLVMAMRGALPPTLAGAYVAAQLIGAALGAWLAHAMFGLDIVQWSLKVRTGPAQWLAEAVATAGLLFVIFRAPAGKAPALVACYIGAAYWFTASTSFANPAAVFGRMMSNTFAGISPADATGFVLAQLAGAGLGVLLHHALGTGTRGDTAPPPSPG